MAVFTILVTQPPFESQAAQSALAFAREVVDAGHQINGVFFYQSGTLNGNSFEAGHSDEVQVYQQWTEFHQQSSVPLVVCVSAANRRGVIGKEEANERDSSQFNLNEPFAQVGLGEFVNMLESSDRMVQF